MPGALFVRGTAAALGSEIVQFVVDDVNHVRFARTHDETRISPAMRCPDVIDRDVIALVPPEQGAGLRDLLVSVRRESLAHTWRFPSVMHPGEWRLLEARPIAGRLGWVSIVVLALRVASGESFP